MSTGVARPPLFWMMARTARLSLLMPYWEYSSSRARRMASLVWAISTHSMKSSSDTGRTSLAGILASDLEAWPFARREALLSTDFPVVCEFVYEVVRILALA